MRIPFQRGFSWRVLIAIGAALLLVIGPAARDSTVEARPLTIVSPGTIAIVTGGGTVFIANGVGPFASFGLNAQRPVNFNGDGTAQGRINYDKHTTLTADRHVNVAVTTMSAETDGSNPNGTGGHAIIVGNCTGGECPTGTSYVIVDVTDHDVPGDTFQIQYCSNAPSPNPPTAFPAACTSSSIEGGPIRTGNIQIRPASSGGGSSTLLNAAPGVSSSTVRR